MSTSIKGIFKNNIVIPLETVDISESEVIIVFPDDTNSKVSLLSKYKNKVPHYDLGLTPDAEYAKNLQEIYEDFLFPNRILNNLLD